MALIKCVECGKEISDKATNCIHCGKKVITKKNSVEKTRKKTNKKSIYISITKTYRYIKWNVRRIYRYTYFSKKKHFI